MPGSEPLIKSLLLALATLALLAPGAAAKSPQCRTTALPWKHMESVKAPGAPVRVWYDARYPADRKRAGGQAREIGRTIMPAFRKVLGDRRPLSDAKVRCRHGGDGRLDVYIVRRKRSELAGDRGAVAVPFTTREPCLVHAPYLVLMRPKLPRSVLAHELFHVMQATYDRKGECEAYQEWDEAMATWAMDFVYPGDQDEHTFRMPFNYPTYHLPLLGYGAWSFLVYLTETQGGHQQIRRILEAEERIPARLIDADNVVDQTIPGGFAARLPEFALYAWNQDPVPTGRIAGGFKAWDGFDAIPMVGTKDDLRPTPTVDVALAGAPSRTDRLDRTGPDTRILSREYFHLRFTDDAVRHVAVRNRWKGVPGAHLTGFVRIGDEWQVVDWTGDETRTFCRDRPDEDVREMVLVVVNSSYEQKILGRPRPEVVSTPSCEVNLEVTAYRETQRDETDLGWSTSDHHLVGEVQPVSRLVVAEDPDREGEHTSYCSPGEPACSFDLYATTENTTDGVIDGPSTFDPCPYHYGVRTFGPFDSIGIGSLVLDLSGPEPKVDLVTSVGHVEVGDATENMCSGRSWAAPDDRKLTPVPWERLLAGEPVTLTASHTGTVPTMPGSRSATIHYDAGTTITLQRVDPDGTPFG